MSKQKRKCHRMDEHQKMYTVPAQGRVGGKDGDTRRSVGPTIQKAWCLQRTVTTSVMGALYSWCEGRTGTHIWSGELSADKSSLECY